MRSIAMCIFLATAALTALRATPSSGASVENGRATFIKSGCWQCHGTVGQGGIAGPKLAPDPIPFDTLSAFVRTTSRLMPPYRQQVLSDEQLADIHAYLSSIPPQLNYKEIPALQP